MPQIILNELVKAEITRFGKLHGIDGKDLEDFTQFIIANYKKKDPKPKSEKTKKVKPLTVSQLKSAIYERFGVKSTPELKKSASFKMAIDGMDDINLTVRESWEKLYREFIGILPEEENQKGYGCINGINIFNYFKPWQIFGLNPQTATTEDIKKAYYNLSKIYHPDVPNTGDSRIFDRINTMYRSISAEA